MKIGPLAFVMLTACLSRLGQALLGFWTSLASEVRGNSEQFLGIRVTWKFWVGSRGSWVNGGIGRQVWVVLG